MLNAQAYFDKHLLRLGDEFRDLWKRRYIRVPLKEPIQSGWCRYHVLTAKAKQRADKEVLLEILKIIGTIHFRNTPVFSKKRGRGRRRRYVEIEQPLHDITVGSWDRMKLPESWKPYFRQEKRCHYRCWHDVLIFIRPHVFELEIAPNWITETHVSDPVVEKRIAEIEAWLWHHNAMHRLNSICGHTKYRRESWRNETLTKIARREMREAWLSLPEVDLAAPVRRRRISLLRRYNISRCSPISRGTALRTQTGASAIAAPAAMPFALCVLKWALLRHAFLPRLPFRTRSFDSEAAAF